MKLAIHGALGRMGQRVMALAQKEEDIEIVALWEHKEHPTQGEKREEFPCAVSFLPEERVSVDVVVDFSIPEALEKLLYWCERYRVPLVSGTTGLVKSQKELMQRVSASIPLVYATNMSLGVNLLRRLVRQAAQVLGDDFDIELVEAHHRHKKDAPSGTCRTLLEDICHVLGRDPEVATFGRVGMTGERRREEIGVHVLRLGGVVGKHWVYFASESEGLTLIHWAESRDVFAKGALRAARWIVKQRAGLYSMEEVLFS